MRVLRGLRVNRMIAIDAVPGQGTLCRPRMAELENNESGTKVANATDDGDSLPAPMQVKRFRFRNKSSVNRRS